MEPVMTKHVEHEHQVIELTADEMERVAGGFMTITLTEAMISSYSMSGGSQPVPSDESRVIRPGVVR
jgi:hypothetical protein